jgi:hypothetical protein
MQQVQSAARRVHTPVSPGTMWLALTPALLLACGPEPWDPNLDQAPGEALPGGTDPRLAPHAPEAGDWLVSAGAESLGDVDRSEPRAGWTNPLVGASGCSPAVAVIDGVIHHWLAGGGPHETDIVVWLRGELDWSPGEDRSLIPAWLEEMAELQAPTVALIESLGGEVTGQLIGTNGLRVHGPRAAGAALECWPDTLRLAQHRKQSSVATAWWFGGKWQDERAFTVQGAHVGWSPANRLRAMQEEDPEMTTEEVWAAREALWEAYREDVAGILGPMVEIIEAGGGEVMLRSDTSTWFSAVASRAVAGEVLWHPNLVGLWVDDGAVIDVSFGW